MRILHTESSWGWGGQEIRILREAKGMRERGHELIFAIVPNGLLIPRLKKEGFKVYDVSFRRRDLFFSLPKLLKIIKDEKVDIINTHSSKDAWIAGFAGRIAKKKIVRTRHLSTDVKPGLNSRLLYNWLLDYLVTTCSSIIPKLCDQSGLSPHLAKCIATGIEPKELLFDHGDVKEFRKKIGIGPDDLLVGTLCFLRNWKGIEDFILAAKTLKDVPNIKWIIVGGGEVEEYRNFAKHHQMQDKIIFTGHLEHPQKAVAAFDIFLLLSTAHEGISQASLQAAFFGKPLITTTIGGLPEVCIDQETGILVPPFSPEKVAQAVLTLKDSPEKREEMGKRAKDLVMSKFTMEQTLDQTELIYQSLCP